MLDPQIIQHPMVPSQLQGLRIAHLTDFHIARRRARHRVIRDFLRDLVGAQGVDLVALTGDYIDHPGDEQVTIEVLTAMLDALHPRLGIFGVLGNHDSPEVRPMLKSLPVTWLENRSVLLSPTAGLAKEAGLTGAGVEVAGLCEDLDRDPDPMQFIAQQAPELADGQRETLRSQNKLFRLMLCHNPRYLPTVADLGLDLMLSGHTHGGQCRLPPNWVLKNSCDLPLRLSSGILQHQSTLCAISRGVGETLLPLRVFCPWHLPVYELRQGPLPREAEQCMHIENTRPW